MKRFILPLLVASAATSASAADLAVRPAPHQPMIQQTAYGYNWTGFYVGGHVGGAWSTMDRTSVTTTTGVLDSTSSDRASSFIGGGQIGYNWMFAPNWVVGVEADISGTHLSSSDTFTNPANGHIASFTNTVDWTATLRGRLGYAWNNWLLYGTGGAAWAHTSNNRTQVIGGGGAAPTGTVETGNDTQTGYAVGGGLEWGFAPNWSLRGEYLYLGFSSDSFNFPISNRTVSWTDHINVGRVGLNYRF